MQLPLTGSSSELPDRNTFSIDCQKQFVLVDHVAFIIVSKYKLPYLLIIVLCKHWVSFKVVYLNMIKNKRKF